MTPTESSQGGRVLEVERRKESEAFVEALAQILSPFFLVVTVDGEESHRARVRA